MEIKLKNLGTRVILCVFVFVLVLGNYAFADIQFYYEELDSPDSIAVRENPLIEISKVSGDKWTLPYVTAHSAILMDAQTGDVLYERDAHKQRPPASTTKILTALIAIEMADLQELATVSDKAGRVGESSIHLNRGNQLKLEELVEGALIRSGNDACVAIAEQTAGSHDEFVRLMNLKAISLGAQNSNFMNTNGLPDKNHYSTAYDLAMITRYAMNNPVFSQIVAQKTAAIRFEVPSKTQTANNTNKLLWNYPWADGVKTGTTNAAGKCLVASATKDGRRLICVVLDAPDRYGDSERLLEWGFQHTEMVAMGKNGEEITAYPGLDSKLQAVLGADVIFCVEKAKRDDVTAQAEFQSRISSSLKAGDVIGSYNILLGDKVLKRVPLVAKRDYARGTLNFSLELNRLREHLLDLFGDKD